MRELDRVITENYKKYLKYAQNMNNHRDDPQDILNECLAELYEKEDSKIEAILGYIDYYLIRMIKFSSQSKTSRYQQKYNKLLIDENKSSSSGIDIIDEEEDFIDISFSDAEKILFDLGYELKVSGSHHVFRKSGYKHVTLKRRHQLLSYQINDLQEALRDHGIKEEI